MIMATGFNTQVSNGEYRLQFETDNREYYLLMQSTARRCVDGGQTTNADRIRSMSDEELAGLIRMIYMSEECPICTLECETCFFKEVCAGTYFGKEIEWLKQPAE